MRLEYIWQSIRFQMKIVKYSFPIYLNILLILTNQDYKMTHAVSINLNLTTQESHSTKTLPKAVEQRKSFSISTVSSTEADLPLTDAEPRE